MHLFLFITITWSIDYEMGCASGLVRIWASELTMELVDGLKVD